MGTKFLKSYAPKASRQFIGAVTKRATHFGTAQNTQGELTISDISF